jgi:hypothetical protein
MRVATTLARRCSCEPSLLDTGAECAPTAAAAVALLLAVPVLAPRWRTEFGREFGRELVADDEYSVDSRADALTAGLPLLRRPLPTLLRRPAFAAAVAAAAAAAAATVALALIELDDDEAETGTIRKWKSDRCLTA